MSPLVFAALVVLVVALGYVLGRRRAISRRGGDEPPIDLTLLLRSPRVPTAEHLRSAVREAFGREPDGPDEFVMAEGPMGLVKFEGYAFGCVAVARPLADDPEKASESIHELRVKTAFAEHQAFITFGSPDRPTGATRQDAYARLGRLVAALVDDTTLIVYAPEANRGTLVNEAALEGLRSGDPIGSMGTLNFDAIGLVSGEDPRLVEATGEARRRLPEFVAAFGATTDPSTFLVKGPFTDGTHTEFMWVQPTRIEGERIAGTLANAPFQVRGLRQGSTVEVAFGEVSDWVYVGEDGPVGLFTERIVRESM